MSEETVTLLWLGSEARLAGADGRPGRSFPVPPEDPASALVRQLGEEFPGAGAVRILYQPATLAIEAIPPEETPDRRTDPRRRGGVWSVEASSSGTEEHLLASEANSPLPALARALEEQGLRVGGAWTLASLLEAEPRNPEEGPACLRLVISGGWALLWSTDALGHRRVRLLPQEAAEAMTAELRSLLATFDEQRRAPAWMALEDEAWPPEIRSALRGLIPVEIPLATLLSQARRLPAGGPSDFLRPHRGRFRLGRPLALAACFALGLAALLAGWRIRETATDRRRQRLFQETATAAARDAQLASARKRDEINRALARASPPRYRLDLLLLALARATPAEICLREIASQGPDFLIRGRMVGAETVTGDPLGTFKQELAAHAAAWDWTETPPCAGGGFLWRGRFRAEAPPSAHTPEEGAARLAQAVARLPAREQAEASIRFLTRDWAGGPEGPADEAGRQDYQFSPANRRLAAWSDIVGTVQALAAAPGVTLEGMELEAGDEGSDVFAQARIEIRVLSEG